jgi:hypothetical protein
MANQFSTSSRNAALNAKIADMGASPTLEIRSGAAPADCSAADSGTLLVSMTLPATWMAAASGGVAAKSGTWQDLAANATGTAGHFRIKQGATCHWQGTVSQRASDGGTGDLQLGQATAGIVAGQSVTIDTFTLTQGGA